MEEQSGPIERMPDQARAAVRQNKYEVQNGEQRCSNLTAADALVKLRELIAAALDPYLYDRFGDQMGLVELEEVMGNQPCSS